MGYYVRYDFHLRIKAAHMEAALADLSALFHSTYDSLEQVVRDEFPDRFGMDLRGLKSCGNGDVEIEYEHDGKYDNTIEKVIKILAPYSEDAEMTFHGEDGESWQVAIVGGSFKRRHTVYETDEEYRGTSVPPRPPRARRARKTPSRSHRAW